MSEEMRCSFCGESREKVAYMVKFPLGPCICDMCVVHAFYSMLKFKAEKSDE